MKITELLDAGPSAHTILSRFAKALEAKGFEAEVKSNSKPGIVNRSKLCIVVKGYGLNDVFKLYRPLFKWEDQGTWFVDSKHEKKFKDVQGMVDALKDKYKRLPKCLEFVPKELKEAAGEPTTRQRVLHLQQAMIDSYATVSDLIVTRETLTEMGADRFVLIADPLERDHAHYEHVKRTVAIVTDYAKVTHNPSDEPVCSVQIWHTEKPYDWLLARNWESFHFSRLDGEKMFSAEDATTGRPESIEEAIAYLTK